MSLRHLHFALEEVDAALKEGDAKYGERAWDNGAPDEENRQKHIDGLARHLVRFLGKEHVDKDSGRRALAHVVARGLLALEFDLRTARELPPCADRHTLTIEDEEEDAICDREIGHEGLHRDSSYAVEWL